MRTLTRDFLIKKKWLQGKDEADPYLIAIGIVQGHVIITRENKNKLPQVAKKYSVETIELNDFSINIIFEEIVKPCKKLLRIK